MKILLTLFVLFFSSSVVAELPISLFGVEILEKGEIYKIDPDIKFRKSSGEYWKFSGCNDYLLGDRTRPRNKNIKLTKNKLFERQCIRMDDDGIIHTISGMKMWEFKDDFEKSNLNWLGLEESIEIQKQIIKNLAKQYQVNEEKFNVTYTYNVINEFRMLNIYFYVSYKNKLKGKLYLQGLFQFSKQKESSPGVGRIGSGSMWIYLTSQKESYDGMVKNIKAKKDSIINISELDNYIELFKSSYSVF